MGYRQLTQTQRYQIHAQQGVRMSQRQIAKVLGIHSSTVSRVVAVLGVENRQVQLVLDQVVYRVLKSAGLKLILVVDHHHGALIVVIGLEAGHADHSSSVFLILPKPRSQRGFSTASTPTARAVLEWRRSRNVKTVAVPVIVRH
ncbi:helix-turn-helix domain-containing protein [Chromohalobacter beijerinckii]|uniref:Helix-turn-helix domain-containing protein n=1 Tax=Chromohalobacter beijerinckii TaxID=86179 RepID=A0ABV8XEL5_9GAMM